MVPSQGQRSRRSVFRREFAKIIVGGVVLVAALYAFDRLRGATDGPGLRLAPLTAPDGGAAGPEPLPPDRAALLGARGPTGPSPAITKALAAGGTSGSLSPAIAKALAAGGTAGLPPAIAQALAARGAAGLSPDTATAPPGAAAAAGDALAVWPKDIPTPPGGQLQTQIALDTRLSLVYETGSAIDQTVAHYKSAMPAHGWKPTDARVSQGGTHLTFTKGDRAASVAVRAPQDGRSTIFLSVRSTEPAPGAPAGPPPLPAPGPGRTPRPSPAPGAAR